MKKTNKILSLALAILLIVGMLPMSNITAFATTTHSHCVCGGNTNVGDHITHKDITFTAWNEYDHMPTKAGNYYLTDNIQLPFSDWRPADGTVLCLNGYSLNSAGGQRAITVHYGANFTLCDCKGTGTVAGQSAYGGGVSLTNDGTVFNMYGGKITGCKSGRYGGGVCVRDQSVFNMYGGSITKNTSEVRGGGVYVEVPNQIRVYGNATITGNTAANGASDNLHLGDVLNREDSPTTVAVDKSFNGKIGVTIRNSNEDEIGVFSVGGANCADNFFSDNSVYTVMAVGGNLELVEKSLEAPSNLSYEAAKLNSTEFSKELSVQMGDRYQCRLGLTLPKVSVGDWWKNLFFRFEMDHQYPELDNISLFIDQKEVLIDKTSGEVEYNSEKVGEFTLSGYENKGKEMTLKLYGGAHAVAFSGKELVLTYESVVTSDAENTNRNSVTVDYELDNGNKNLKDTLTTEDIIYHSYSLEFTRDFDDPNIEFDAVKYNLYTDVGNKTPLSFLIVDKGVYKFESFAIPKLDVTTDLLLADDGTLTIMGFDANKEYCISEIAVQEGLNTTEDIKVEFNQGDYLKKITVKNPHTASNYIIEKNTHSILCLTCGAVLEESEHQYGEFMPDTDAHTKTCICTKKITETHSGGTATCTAKAKCEVCDTEYGELLDHKYEWVTDKEPTASEEGLKHEECTVCQAKRNENTAIPKTETRFPQTGDKSNMALLVALLFLGGLGIVATTVVSRKRRKN